MTDQIIDLTEEDLTEEELAELLYCEADETAEIISKKEFYTNCWVSFQKRNSDLVYSQYAEKIWANWNK